MASLPFFLILSSLLIISVSPLPSDDFDKQLELDLTARPRRPRPSPSPPPPPPPPPPCDYYILALQWPISFCNDKSEPNRCDRTGKPRDLPLYYTIHGLWPEKNSGEKLEKCTTEKFDPTQISVLFDDLKKYMPTLKKYNDPVFTSYCQKHWEHEWEVHGTCSGLSQKGYFEMALNLRKKINIPTSLPTGYQPGKSFKAADMQAEIAKIFTPATATITCNTGKTDKEQLYEVWFSIDLAGNLQAMSKPRVSCSTGTVLLPSAPRLTTQFGFGNYLPSGHFRNTLIESS